MITTLAAISQSGAGLSLLSFVILEVLLACGVFALQKYAPAGLIRTVIIVVLCIVAVVLALNYLGVMDELRSL